MTKIKHFFSRIGRAVRNFFVSDADRESGLLQSVRKPATQTILASVACALMGIIIGFIILLCINPAHAGKGIFAILKNFLNYKRPELRLKYFGNTLVMAAPLIMCSLSVLFAYKAGLFNIGAAGQYCVAMGVALYAAHAWQLPWILCLLLAIAAGALWGALSGALKAFFNINEVIACIMLNWIGLYMVNNLVQDTRVMNISLSETYHLKSHAPKAILPHLGLDKLLNNEYATIALPLTIIMAVLVWVVLNRTTFGYELKATGFNKHAAKYAGMQDKRNIILTMTISGALAGMAAAFYYLTGIENYVKGASLPAMGFNGIAVAFLGGLHPIGVLFAGYFIEHITVGGSTLDTNYYNPQVADLMVSIIIYLCAFVLFMRLFIKRRLASHDEKAAKRAQKAEIAEDAAAHGDGTKEEEA